MKYEERRQDLFTVDMSYQLAHCISADFKLGAGIAVQIEREFGVKHTLKELYPNYLECWIHGRYVGDCLSTGRVFNLVTKERFYHKPTYDAIEESLITMRHVCEESGITKIAMPKIGCGLDKLDWGNVSYIVQNTFKDMDIEILICYL